MKLKPGSMYGEGAVIDYMGYMSFTGPCWVPRNLGVSGNRCVRRGLLYMKAGWRVLNPTHPQYPSIPPRDDLICVARVGKF